MTVLFLSVAEEGPDIVRVASAESEAGLSPVEEKPLAPPKYEVRPGLGEK